MKNISYTISLFAFLLCLMTSCQKDNAKQKPPESLNLVSPNNTAIASSEADLNAKISPTINSKFQIETDFKIQSINFLNVKEGAVADIHYKTSTGIETNIIYITNYPLNKLFKGNKPLFDNKSTLKEKPITFSCSGGDCCQVHVHIDDSGVHGDCTCNPCTMTVH
jgi:hypothetical protein